MRTTKKWAIVRSDGELVDVGWGVPQEIYTTKQEAIDVRREGEKIQRVEIRGVTKDGHVVLWSSAAPCQVTAEERLREVLTMNQIALIVMRSDLSELLSTLDALRKSYEERGQAITALAARPCKHCGGELAEAVQHD